jgi:sporadic carbohydrate cluster protein (TIGR04323 family)
MNDRADYRGYVTSRQFGGYSVPVPIQSLVLREYCGRKNFRYVLPVNENTFPHSYLVLEGLAQDLDGFGGILLFSMHMLPRNAERRRELYALVLNQGCSMHFVFENLVVASAEDADRLEELLQLSQAVEKAPQYVQVDE